MTKDDKFWVNAAYVAFALIIAYVGFKAIYTVGIQFGWLERYDTWYPMASNIGAVVIGLGAVFWLKSSTDRTEYHIAAVGELKKVTWPGKKEIIASTVIVLIVGIFLMLYIGVVDFGLSKVVKFIFR